MRRRRVSRIVGKRDKLVIELERGRAPPHMGRIEPRAIWDWDGGLATPQYTKDLPWRNRTYPASYSASFKGYMAYRTGVALDMVVCVWGCLVRNCDQIFTFYNVSHDDNEEVRSVSSPQ